LIIRAERLAIELLSVAAHEQVAPHQDRDAHESVVVHQQGARLVVGQRIMIAIDPDDILPGLDQETARAAREGERSGSFHAMRIDRPSLEVDAVSRERLPRLGRGGSVVLVVEDDWHALSVEAPATEVKRAPSSRDSKTGTS
jgi:hypothetical protein